VRVCLRVCCGNFSIAGGSSVPLRPLNTSALAQCQHAAARWLSRRVRACSAVGRTVVMHRPWEFLRYALGSRALIGKTFAHVVNAAVTRPDVRALVDLITEGTCSAGAGEVDAAYMVRAIAEMWSPGTQLQYPKVSVCIGCLGGSGESFARRLPIGRMMHVRVSPWPSGSWQPCSLVATITDCWVSIRVLPHQRRNAAQAHVIRVLAGWKPGYSDSAAAWPGQIWRPSAAAQPSCRSA
jgi:hypothetical protein